MKPAAVLFYRELEPGGGSSSFFPLILVVDQPLQLLWGEVTINRIRSQYIFMGRNA